MAVGKNAGKATSGWKPQTKWQGNKSTNKSQDGVARRPSGVGPSKAKKRIVY